MHLLVAAAGSGTRMGAGKNKILLPLLGKSLLQWTLVAAARAQTVEWIGIMTSPDAYDFCQQLIATLQLPIPVVLCYGGATRQASVQNGLAALPDQAQQVLIHDGARCLVTPDLIDRCAQALQTQSAIIAAIPVKDTIKLVHPDGLIAATPPREQLWAAQTPQGFGVELLKAAHAKATAEQWSVTDDAALFERLGLPVAIVPGEETNLKITTPLDLVLARVILEQRG